MKVFGWTGFYSPSRNRHHQVREICAVKSKAELKRITGFSMSYINSYVAETGNAQEIAVATARPGVRFWKELDDYYGEYQERKGETK